MMTDEIRAYRQAVKMLSARIARKASAEEIAEAKAIRDERAQACALVASRAA